MDVKLKLQILPFYCCLALSVLLIIGCTHVTDNVALSPDGVEIRFDEAGKGKPAIVLVHGWSNSKDIWDAQLLHFAKKYKVVAVDLAGFGESGNNRSEWTMSAFAGDVSAVIEKLKLKEVVLVGFSMGALVVIETANKLPNIVTGVVLVDELHDVEMKFPPPVVHYMDSMMMDVVTNPSIEKMGYFFRNNVEEAYKQMLTLLGDGPRSGWRESLHGSMEWYNEDIREALGNLQVPIVAINSNQVETKVEAFRNHVPSFEAKIIPDVGHMLMWDATEEFNQLLEETITEYNTK